METIQKINDELAIAGQISADELSLIAKQGYKSILNLRTPDEEGFNDLEQLSAWDLGLKYLNIPMHQINPHMALFVLQQITELPKPMLIHCDCASRSVAMALIYIATRQGVSLEDAFAQAKKLGVA